MPFLTPMPRWTSLIGNSLRRLPVFLCSFDCYWECDAWSLNFVRAISDLLQRRAPATSDQLPDLSPSGRSCPDVAPHVRRVGAIPTSDVTVYSRENSAEIKPALGDFGASHLRVFFK